MMKSQNKYSIRKFSVGASSILIATLLFLSGGQAQAAEKQVNMGNSQEDTVTAQSIGDQQTRENANYQRENGVDEQQHTENLTKNLHNDKIVAHHFLFSFQNQLDESLVRYDLYLLLQGF